VIGQSAQPIVAQDSGGEDIGCSDWYRAQPMVDEDLGGEHRRYSD
jgi:hypothetical protein